MAFYQNVIGEIPQRYTTCFSRSPAVIPMWAHYAEGLTGVVLEFDEVKLKEHFPTAGFGDIDYMDSAPPEMNRLLEHAHGTRKFRHSKMLLRAAFSAAYYTKASPWSFEQERRMVVGDEDLEHVGGVPLLLVPRDCVTAIITGARASEQVVGLSRQRAGALGSTCYEMRIGRMSPAPYFEASGGLPFEFDGTTLSPSEAGCVDCGEPLRSSRGQCAWCAVANDEQVMADNWNPLVVLEDLGMLDGYMKD